MNGALQRRAAAAGFTLVEILVAVAILAVLSATLSPLVVKHIKSGRIARARSDARTITDAISAFQIDTSRWPVSSDGVLGATEEVSRLIGLPAAQISDVNVPDGAGSATGDASWDGGGDGGNAAALEDQLIFNQSDSVNPLYPTSGDPSAAPGWRGPYLEKVPLDPWGQPYVCNVRYLRSAGVSGVTTAEASDHAVYCLSAGSNGLFETSFDDATSLGNLPGGDDVGSLLQANETRTGSGGGAAPPACGFLGIEPPLGLLLVRAFRRHRRRRAQS